MNMDVQGHEAIPKPEGAACPAATNARLIRAGSVRAAMAGHTGRSPPRFGGHGPCAAPTTPADAWRRPGWRQRHPLRQIDS